MHFLLFAMEFRKAEKIKARRKHEREYFIQFITNDGEVGSLKNHVIEKAHK